MMPFVLLSWDQGNCAADAIARRIKDLAHFQPAQWRSLVDRPGEFIAVGFGAKVLSGQVEGHRTFVIGDIFSQDDAAPEMLLTSKDTFDNLCRDLADRCWGAYTAVQIRVCAEISVFRDPVGMRDVITWIRSGLRVVATDPMPWLTSSPPHELSIDWNRIGELLSDSTSLSEAPPLAGIASIPAGWKIDMNCERSVGRRLWEPRRFYCRAQAHRSDAPQLREIVTHCVDAWRTAYPTTMVEISGGFDSAVVATAIAGATEGTCRGVNFYTADVAGDERRYARDAAVASDIPLDEIFMPVGSISDIDIDGMPIGARPGLGSTTLFHDRLLARRAVAYGADALLTGHGGDSVFFQHPTAMIAADPSFPRTTIGSYLALAKWSKSSVWAVAGHALGFPRARPQLAVDESMISLPLNRPGPRAASGWAGNLAGLPPAKRAQILGVAGDRNAFGPSWRSEAMPVIHPLLSQPIVQWAIATDTYALTRGRRDRALARDAFSQALPHSIAYRRGKGGAEPVLRSVASRQHAVSPLIPAGWASC